MAAMLGCQKEQGSAAITDGGSAAPLSVGEGAAVPAGTAPIPEEPLPANGVWTQPPGLTLVWESGALAAAPGGYHWRYENGDGTQTDIEADSLHPLDEAFEKPMISAAEQPPADTYQLSFADEVLPDQVTIRAWNVSDLNEFALWDTPQQDVPVEDLHFTPLTDGCYVYEVTASWDGDLGFGGTATYAFQIDAVWQSCGVICEEDFEAYYVRTNGGMDEVEYPQVTVISSTAELEDYRETYGEFYDLSHRAKTYESDTEGFADLVENCDGEFFREHVLVLILLEESSGSVGHEVTGVLEDGTITIRRDVPEIGTDDMAQWHVLLMLPRTAMAFAGGVGFTVVFV